MAPIRLSTPLYTVQVYSSASDCVTLVMYSCDSVISPPKDLYVDTVMRSSDPSRLSTPGLLHVRFALGLPNAIQVRSRSSPLNTKVSLGGVSISAGSVSQGQK